MQGDTDAEFALSEMLISESVDLFEMISEVHWEDNNTETYGKLFTPNGKFETQCKYLERLFPEGQDYFNSRASGEHKKLAGGLAIAAVLDIAVGACATCLDATPKLKRFYELVVATPAFDGLREMKPFFKPKEA
jgi:hypothetical protein